MRIHAVEDQDRAVARLAGQVDRLDRAVGTTQAGLARLVADVAEHGKALRVLAGALRDPAGPGAAPAAPPEWMTVDDPVVAVGLLSHLTVWVETVWVRYGPLPVCWAWHAPVVAELLACRQAWTAATAAGAGPDAMASWHDRWRPGAARRIRDHVAGCARKEDGRHVEGATVYQVDTSCLDEVAVWWATSHGATLAPGLTHQLSGTRQ